MALIQISVGLNVTFNIAITQKDKDGNEHSYSDAFLTITRCSFSPLEEKYVFNMQMWKNGNACRNGYPPFNGDIDKSYLKHVFTETEYLTNRNCGNGSNNDNDYELLKSKLETHDNIASISIVKINKDLP
jgi:hypothetical protein